MDTKIDLNEFITLSKAAELKGCTPGKLRHWILNGHVLAIKVGPRAWLVNRQSVVDFEPRSVGRPRKDAEYTNELLY